MGDVVNLNRFRKVTKKRDDKARAAANRTLYGTSGADRAKLESERERARALLDGHKREPAADTTAPLVDETEAGNTVDG